ncbi:hypothetical protein S2M10_25600 [Sphingomonas sp. S2M10]|uniref:hypothetical protein n=1 Tax=Sphingomonas sp. S2M10 TaxID=2705010 RepID=UPI001456B4CA|nr:hypothetical protein [Sphingomonas sp. S2M10]NLS27563.1 hypothetical protein [Sphingomonas sp. S2M10]
MTAADLIDRIVAQLVRRHGGTVRRWKTVLGKVRVYDAKTHPHCNWSLAPSGAAGDVAAVEKLLDELRITYPIVSG